MPVTCDPNARRRYVLKGDRKLPAERRAVFVFRFLTRREKRAFWADPVMPKDGPKLTEEQLDERLRDRIDRVLTGWENLRGPNGTAVVCTPDWTLAELDFLTDREVWELYSAAGSDVELDDLDFFASPPSASPGGSASPPPAGAATPGGA